MGAWSDLRERIRGSFPGGEAGNEVTGAWAPEEPPGPARAWLRRALALAAGRRAERVAALPEAPPLIRHVPDRPPRPRRPRWRAVGAGDEDEWEVPPARPPRTVTTWGKTVPLPADAGVLSTSPDFCEPPLPDGGWTVLYRGRARAWVGRRSGKVLRVVEPPGYEGAFDFLKEALGTACPALARALALTPPR